MTVTILHYQTLQEATEKIDHATAALFEKGIGAGVELVDPKREWTDSTMYFSVTVKVGFITVPIAGELALDEQNVAVTCELPAMVNNFLGEAKVRAGIESKMQEILA